MGKTNPHRNRIRVTTISKMRGLSFFRCNANMIYAVAASFNNNPFVMIAI
jgi:hypothetical protein